MGKMGKIGTPEIPEEIIGTLQETDEEFLIVTGGDFTGAGGFPDSFYLASLNCPGGVVLADGTVIKSRVRISWVLTEQERESKEYFYYFNKNTIYKIRGRRPKPETGKSRVQRIYVREILEENVPNAELAEILSEYKKEVSAESNVLGRLVLNKDYDRYEGAVMWCGERVNITVAVTDANAADAGIAFLERFVVTAGEWDEKMRSAAAGELLGIVNRGREEPNDPMRITGEEFARRLMILSINMTTEGKFLVYYDDDTMLRGKPVCVYGNMETGIDLVQPAE